ncbi:MAG: hypothetical protein A3G75_11115 [Verrucomicrobia bacterium RIFCSPLOWO2_12_FULL_64_8]|nr:MAG: hypothetical protein A3G75_11115 [Verrucomicrobia bacterium RIFCSPLOWO2_12_FULL_64_8]
MRLPLYWIDAFTDRIFAGNPAAVVPLERWLPDELLQRIALENGLSETAFFVPAKPSDESLAATAAETAHATSAKAGDRSARFHLRWFTPAVEVDLCGHATLATAFTLFTQLGEAGERITFETRSGPLYVRCLGSPPSEANAPAGRHESQSTSATEGGARIVARQSDERLELDFPATPAWAETDPAQGAAVAAALGATPGWLGRTRFDLFAVLPDAATVHALRPDFPRVAALDCRGLIVTAAGGDGCDFVSRFFAPRCGIREDPVTGSAHSALTPYWAERLGRTRLHARQVSARGGELWCEARGDRVGIAGHAMLYLRGEINV